MAKRNLVGCICNIFLKYIFYDILLNYSSYKKNTSKSISNSFKDLTKHIQGETVKSAILYHVVKVLGLCSVMV